MAIVVLLVYLLVLVTGIIGLVSVLRQRSWRSLLVVVLLGIAHFLVLWWSVANTSSAFWVMEGGASTLMGQIAEWMTITLGGPIALPALFTGLYPVVIAAIPCNSLLWGTSLYWIVGSVAARFRSG